MTAHVGSLAFFEQAVAECRALGGAVNRVTMRRSDAERFAAREHMTLYAYQQQLRRRGLTLVFSNKAAGDVYLWDAT